MRSYQTKQLHTQNDLLMNCLMDFYQDKGRLRQMMGIINGESKISLRIVDWFVTNYAKMKYTIYPPGQEIFSAFDHTPFEQLKVVILGQDPYHGKGQAHGLCFSVPDGITKPPSLVNIFKEIKDDLGHEIPLSGNLEKWARQGVLLLNAFLTVRANTPTSHQNIGWQQFTDAVIQSISAKKNGVVFLLWGNFQEHTKNK